MKIKTYDNKLRLVVNTKSDNDVIVCKILVCVGAKDEKESEYGYAHFLEHMFFKSTKDSKGEDIIRKLDGCGSYKNAYTSQNVTSYYFKCISPAFEEVLKIYSEMFFNKTYKKQEVESEKSVILEEYNMTLANNTKHCMSLAVSNFFANTPFEHEVIGTPETISSVTPKKLAKFKEKYTPNKIIISISGNIKFSVAEKLVNKYFSSKFDKQNQLQDYKEDEYFAIKPNNKYLAKQKKIEQSKVCVLIDLKSPNRRQRRAFDLFFAVLGFGMSSKLYETIRVKEGLVYSINSSISLLSNNCVALINFSTAHDKVSKVLSLIKQIILDCANGAISDEELKRVKMRYISGLEFSSETNEDVAENNAYDMKRNNKVYSNKELATEYMEVTLKEVLECAKIVAEEQTYVVCSVGECKKTDLKAY